MCQFNLLITDKKLEVDELKNLVDEIGFLFREINNDSLTRQIGKDKRIILTTKGNCDCGSIIGFNYQSSTDETNIEKERKRLTKKKWSESKINRYVENKIKEQSKKDKESESVQKQEEGNWIELANQLINKQIEFGIYYQQFGGLIEDEIIKLRGNSYKTIDELKNGELRNLKESRMIWIKK